MPLSQPVFRLKREARLLARRESIPLHAALDRMAVAEGYKTWSLLIARAGTGDAVDPNRLGDILEVVLAEILEGRAHLASGLSVGVSRKANAARRRQLLQPGGDIDSLAMDVLALDDHVPEVDADAVS